ncbi:AfsR/SARP family transcriptional regulator [Modestobacter lapidis]|nr:SARP family transcriptional regulator [Modestobacter lapidis]
MTATIRLLGRPRIERDGAPAVAPRGNKAWALLTYLVLAGCPPSRQHLASLLFGDALDPLGALRWNLSELRRALAGIAVLDGGGLALTLSPACGVDVRQLTDGTSAQALALADFGAELLEGVALPDAPGFEAWLAAERCRITSCTETVLVEAALDLLAAGSAAAAARLAARAVAMNPLDPDHHAVLVRSLTAAGDRPGARRQALRCTDLFRRELGCAPPAEVLAAATDPVPRQPPLPASAAAVRSYLDAGRASLMAGAVERALEQLRRAAGMAVEVGEPALRATAYVALAGARVHAAGERGTAVRGLLQEAAALARGVQAGDIVAAACRELGFLALQRGQQDRALLWLDEGRRSTGDDAEIARLLGVRGMCLTDGADYPGALAALDRSAALARQVGDSRQEAWSLSMIGRRHALRGEYALAAAVLDGALEKVARQDWTAFQPWPTAFRAEAAVGLGDLNVARELLDHAWVLATESDDHCWMATVAHGQATLSLAEGSPERARRWCDQGLTPAPWYLWPYARLLDVVCTITLDTAPAAAAGPVDRLADLASRGSMRDLLVRVHLHRARAGSRTALAAATAIAGQIDDPALQARIQACPVAG